MVTESTMKRDSFAFSLVYEGQALDDHTMAVESFAPALISLSNALVAINKKANQGSVDVKLKVNAQFIAGSFGIELWLDQSVLTAVTSLFIEDKTTAFVNAYALFCALRDLVNVKKFLKGRKPDSVTFEGDKVKYQIENNICVINLLAHEAFKDGRINEACNRIVEPLNEEGVDCVRFRSKDGGEFEIEKGEICGFTASANTENLSENIIPRVGLQITSPNFNEGTKWLVTLGEKTPIFVSISDQDFLKRIDSGQETFGKGDILVADLKVTQTIQNEKISIAYDVMKVLDHRHAFQQMDMDLGK